MKFSIAATFCGIFLLSACVQIPKESVELSTQVGKVIELSHNSHRETTKLLFQKIRGDVNRFIDEVYAPYQIREASEADLQRANSVNPKDKEASLFLGISTAFSKTATPQEQEAMLEGMEILISELHKNIENKRLALLTPIAKQEREYLLQIDKNYTQIIYANSVITGYLSSAVKVVDAQKQLLKDAGLKENLNEELGKKIADASDKISEIVQKAKRADDKIKSAKSSLSEIEKVLEFSN